MAPNVAETALANPAFLVHIDCECGWVAGVPEGSKWPDCPYCKKPVPTRAERDSMLGYVAVRSDEVHAARVVASTMLGRM